MTIGYADLHCHPMAHLSFGGDRNGRALFWGNPTKALPLALPCCTPAHSFWNGAGLSRVLPWFAEHEFFHEGFNRFRSWPHPRSRIHQQMYVSQVHRAFTCGLKLLVASAVNNELLADVYHRDKRYSGDDLAIEEQLKGIRSMADENATWMTIVQSPGEARGAIDAGKLAIILGIEVDSIAGPEMRREGQLEPQEARQIVDRWWQKGVRLINPIHLADNALGGTAIFNDLFNCLNHYLTRKWTPYLPEPFYEVDQASKTSGIEFLLSATNSLLVSLYSFFEGQYPSYIKKVGDVGHINAHGLSSAGEAFIRAMMEKGMLIDVEHMSSRALARTLEIAECEEYPLISSHTAPRAMAVPREESEPITPGCGTEAMRSDEELERLRRLGGVLGIGGHVGIIKHLKYDASRSWAAAYHHALELGFESVAIGTDMNGFAEAPGPRFELDNQLPTGLRNIDPSDNLRPVRYGKDHIPRICKLLEQTALGGKKYDFNVHGLAHYGLLPDFTVDLALSPEGKENIGAFFNSADALVAAWSRCAAP